MRSQKSLLSVLCACGLMAATSGVEPAKAFETNEPIFRLTLPAVVLGNDLKLTTAVFINRGPRSASPADCDPIMVKIVLEELGGFPDGSAEVHEVEKAELFRGEIGAGQVLLLPVGYEGPSTGTLAVIKFAVPFHKAMACDISGSAVQSLGDQTTAVLTDPSLQLLRNAQPPGAPNNLR